MELDAFLGVKCNYNADIAGTVSTNTEVGLTWIQLLYSNTADYEYDKIQVPRDDNMTYYRSREMTTVVSPAPRIAVGQKAAVVTRSKDYISRWLTATVKK